MPFSLNTVFKLFFVTVITILLIFSCKKNSSNGGAIPTPVTPPDLTTLVSSSVSGFVTNENDVAVSNANVQVGGTTIVTDKYGYFEAKNVNVVMNAATVTVTKTGYFKGIKTYIATVGKAAFFRIKLIPKTIAGTISGSTGGTVTLPNGLSITLPATGMVNATTNAAYSGTVNVAAYWINPTSADLPRIMPGDLRGLNTNGNLQLLTTYGMAAVELTGSGGELLQIATGKKATLSLLIPPSILSTAPATIPLWYFDETNGLWKQEGTATKTGNNYVGDVSHFSFWNCDRAVPYVMFNATITNSTGQPVSNALVKVFLSSQPNDAHFGYTNDLGYISDGVPVNSQLVLEVLGEWGCNVALFSNTFSTGTTDISLGNLALPASATAEISGKVVDCNTVGISNGSLVMLRNGINLRYPVSNTGTFSFVTSVCSQGSTITLTGQDLTTNIQTSPTNFTINSGVNNAGNLTACAVVISEFVNYSVNGISYAKTKPPDNIGLNGASNGYEIFAYRTPTTNEFTRFSFSKIGIAANTNMPLVTFNSNDISANGTVTANSIMVHITEYGPINGYISGNFSGTINNISSPGSPYSITCNFRVLRWF